MKILVAKYMVQLQPLLESAVTALYCTLARGMNQNVFDGMGQDVGDASM